MKIKLQKLTTGAVLIAAASAFLFCTGFTKASDYGNNENGYLKSATYYSDDWVINFWNSESSYMDEELAQIAEDGFNSIILVVPWREFQPSMSPQRYNDYAWEKFDRVMETAERQSLKVMLRVGYTWDYYSSDNVLERYEKLLYDEETKQAWMQYAKRLYEKAAAHENFCGGFITWEDFWNFAENSVHYGSGLAGKKMAAKCGYTQYVKEHYTLEELEEMYQDTFESYEDVYLPDSLNSYGRKAFYQFYDDFLNKILAETQTVFPDLSMEVRLDIDPVRRPDGTLEGAPHDSTFPCGSSGFSSAMYSVCMGFESNGQEVSAAQAITNAGRTLDRLSAASGGKKLYLDQFLFTDNTPGFEQNAKLAESEKNAYLDGIADVFKAKTMGYGIWTYRDYGDNKLYNPQFALDKQGWTFSGGSYIENRNGNKMAAVPSSGKISQSISKRSAGGKGKKAYVRFFLEGDGNCRVTVQGGGKSQTVSAGSPRTVELTFADAAISELSFTVQGTGKAYIDDVKVYTWITEGNMYHMDGSESSCAQALRAMNQKVQ